MKFIKRILAIVFVGFFAFAPPGTLIALFLLATALIGNVWIVAAAVLAVAAFGAWFFVRKRFAKTEPTVDFDKSNGL